MSSLIPVLLFCIGGIFDAIMDTLSDHFGTSVFKSLNPQFWNKNLSWTNKYVDGDPSKGLVKWWVFNKPVCFTDGWHLAKTIKEILNAAALTLAIQYVHTPTVRIADTIGTFLLIGVARDIVFSVFYDEILKSK
jgi:hypothetical protein